MCFLQPNSHSHYLCLKLKPLYKELLYTITHKMGNPSSTEVFTNKQLQQYIKEVKKKKKKKPSASHITHMRYGVGVMADYRAYVFFFHSVCPIYQAFTMTESEHNSLMERVQSTEVRKGSQHVCSNECVFFRPLTSIHCTHTEDLTFRRLLFGLLFVSGRNGVISSCVFPWFMEDLGSCCSWP